MKRNIILLDRCFSRRKLGNRGIVVFCVLLGLAILGLVTYTAIHKAERTKYLLEMQAQLQEVLAREDSVAKQYEALYYEKLIVEIGLSHNMSNKKMVCMGDSLVAGVGSVEDDHKGWPDYLGQMLGIEEVINLGVGGATYGDYWEINLKQQIPDVPKDADLILVMAGYNDYFTICSGIGSIGEYETVNQDTFYTGIESFFQELQEACPNAEIILVTPMPNKSEDYYEGMTRFSEFVDILMEVAEKEEISVCDVYHSGLLNGMVDEIRTAFFDDDVHLNQYGYRILSYYIGSYLATTY